MWDGMRAAASWWHLELLPLPAPPRSILSLLWAQAGLVNAVPPDLLEAWLAWAAFSSEQLFAFLENWWLLFG